MATGINSVRSFQDLDAWKLGRVLAKEIYEETSRGDFSKDFGLKNQIQRAAVSIVSNIAEGFERNGDTQFIQYLYMAKGSVGELRTQLCIAKDLNYLTEESFQKLWEMATRVGEIISGLIRYLKKSELKGSKFN